MWTTVIERLLLPPAGPLLAMLLAGLLRGLGLRRSAVVLTSLAILTLWLASTPFVAGSLLAGIEARSPAVPIEATPRGEAIVLLGGSLSPALPPRLWPDLSDAADRPLHAARLYRAGKAPLVVVSGGSQARTGASRSEADDVTDLLVEWGVPREAILAEGRSLDTHGNAAETTALLADRGIRRVLLVTSALHMERAVETFERRGLEVIPSPTDYEVVDAGEATLIDWIPSARALDHTRRALHEVLGRLWYRFRD